MRSLFEFRKKSANQNQMIINFYVKNLKKKRRGIGG